MRLHQLEGGRRDHRLAAARYATRRTTGTLSPPLTSRRHRRNQQIDQPVDAGRLGPLALRRTSRSWRRASLQRKTQVSTRRIGCADDTDCTRSYLRLDRLAGCLDSYTIHQRFWPQTTPVSPEPLNASDGPRDEEPRHRPSPDRRRCRLRSPSHRIWARAGHSLRGSMIMVRNSHKTLFHSIDGSFQLIIVRPSVRLSVCPSSIVTYYPFLLHLSRLSSGNHEFLQK
jgi:hypothetical protein